MSAVSHRSARIARVLLRLPSDLHRSLTRAAADAGLSFNEFCVRRLASPGLPDEVSGPRRQVLERARAVLGDRVQGLVALGSWARDEAAAGSDIDVLVVIAPSVELTRDLYRTWDASPVEVEGRAVDAHFTHLPSSGVAPGSVWCEAAIDGLLWYDRDGRVATRLAEVRRAIANGRVTRAFVHGQPYWKGAA
jgi:predicted nucleotidyltransferase